MSNGGFGQNSESYNFVSNFVIGTKTKEARLCLNVVRRVSIEHPPDNPDLKFLHIYQKSLAIHYDAIDFLFQLPKAKYLLINIR